MMALEMDEPVIGDVEPPDELGHPLKDDRRFGLHATDKVLQGLEVGHGDGRRGHPGELRLKSKLGGDRTPLGDRGQSQAVGVKENFRNLLERLQEAERESLAALTSKRALMEKVASLTHQATLASKGGEEISSLKSRCRSLEGRVREAERAEAAAMAEREDLRADRDRRSAESGRLREELAESRLQLRKVTERHQQEVVEREAVFLEDLDLALMEREREWRARENELKKLLTSKNETKELAEKYLRDLEAKSDEKSRELRGVRDELKRSHRNEARLREQLSHLEDRLEKAERSSDEKELELENLKARLRLEKFEAQERAERLRLEADKYKKLFGSVKSSAAVVVAHPHSKSSEDSSGWSASDSTKKTKEKAPKRKAPPLVHQVDFGGSKKKVSFADAPPSKDTASDDAGGDLPSQPISDAEVEEVVVVVSSPANPVKGSRNGRGLEFGIPCLESLSKSKRSSNIGPAPFDAHHGDSDDNDQHHHRSNGPGKLQQQTSLVPRLADGRRASSSLSLNSRREGRIGYNIFSYNRAESKRDDVIGSGMETLDELSQRIVSNYGKDRASSGAGGLKSPCTSAVTKLVSPKKTRRLFSSASLDPLL